MGRQLTKIIPDLSKIPVRESARQRATIADFCRADMILPNGQAMTLRTGIDLCEIARLRQAIERQGRTAAGAHLYAC